LSAKPTNATTKIPFRQCGAQARTDARSDYAVLDLPACRQAGLVTFSIKGKSDKQTSLVKIIFTTITNKQHFE